MNNNQKKWRYYYYKNLFDININIDSTSIISNNYIHILLNGKTIQDLVSPAQYWRDPLNHTNFLEGKKIEIYLYSTAMNQLRNMQGMKL